MRKIGDLRLSDLQAVLDEHAGESKSSLNNIKIVMSFVFEWAIKNDIIDKNYAKFVEAKPRQTKSHEPFTHAEFNAAYEARNDSLINKLIVIYLHTGVRPIELLLLKKDNIHLADQYFRITEAKTSAGIRIVPIADKIVSLLGNVMSMSDTEYLTNIGYPDFFTGFVDLYPCHTPHDTRTTFISFMTEKDVPQIIIQKIVGHRSGNVTGDVYTKLSLQPLLDAVNKL